MENNIYYRTGTLEQYNKLKIKNENTIYWLYDVQQLYKGSVLYATGALATQVVDGLLSKEDKQLLNKIVNGELSDFVIHDSTLTSNSESKALGVKVQEASQNALQSTSNGLYVYNNESELNALQAQDASLTGIITNVATTEDIDRLLQGEEFEPSTSITTKLGTIVEDYIRQQVQQEVEVAIQSMDLSQTISDYVDNKLKIDMLNGGDCTYIQESISMED